MRDNTLLVSIIIPCYNVAAYVEQCILSIVHQTYPNIEVLAIDDGSPDNTSAILDKLAQEYPQVKVIHQQNAGVSAARNTGIAQATGDYIMFVDGDDFLAPDAVAYFVDLVCQTNAPFALSMDCFQKHGEAQTKPLISKTVSCADAVALLLSPRVVVGCWNKIYKRELLIKHNCYFATDLFYGGGLNFIITVAQLAGQVGVGNRKVYYYRRNNVASATSQFDIRKIYNGIVSLDRIEKNLWVHTPQITTMLLLHRSMFYLAAAVRIITAGQLKIYAQKYKEYISYVRRNYSKLLFNREVSLYRKCLLGAGCVSPWLLSKLDIIRRKRIVANSI